MDYQDVADWSFPVAPILQHSYELDLAIDPTPNDSSKSQMRSPRVAMACLRCRTRKVRCDAVQPKCNNCTKRFEDCEYIVPKLRGPDKQPGSRVRTWWRKPAGNIDPQLVQRVKRRKNGRFDELRRAIPEGVRNAAATRTAPEDFDSVSPPLTSSLTTGLYPVPVEDQNLPWNFNNTISYNSESIKALGFLPNTPLYPSSAQTNRVHFGSNHMSNDIPRGPYTERTHHGALRRFSRTSLSCALNFVGRSKLMKAYRFSNAIYWHSFINLHLLLEKLCDPIQRENLQPSIVLSSLALATLMKSSETGLGERGRLHALMLRDAAQSSLEASISAGWIEPSLAQAALLLTLFEASAHPYHTPSRTTSAIYLMDSLIRALGLLILDVHEPTVSIFPADQIPVTSTNVLSLALQPGGTSFSASDMHQYRKAACACPETSGEFVHHSFSRILGTTQDWDEEFAEKLLRPLPSLQLLDGLEARRTLRVTSLGGLPGELDRVWDQSGGGGNVDSEVILKQPDWPDPGNKAEIQKEELRRLCWSALIIITTLLDFTPYLGQCGWDLHIMKQETFAIFFPGESRSHSPNESHTSKETIWALHCRSVLLWNVSQKLRQRPDWDSRKAEFSGRAWMEASAIESALAEHTCSIATSAHYPVREFLFQIKLLISNNFTRFIPLPHTLSFDRDGAEEWLIQRGETASHVRKMVYFITRSGAGPAALGLAKHPLSVWWTFHQIRAGTAAWRVDRSLKVALEHSLDFVALADFMTAMWPSPNQQSYYSKLKNELAEACAMAGVSIPASVPIPGLPHRPEAAMAPSPLPFRSPAAADIPILPLD